MIPQSYMSRSWFTWKWTLQREQPMKYSSHIGSNLQMCMRSCTSSWSAILASATHELLTSYSRASASLVRLTTYSWDTREYNTSSACLVRLTKHSWDTREYNTSSASLVRLTKHSRVTREYLWILVKFLLGLWYQFIVFLGPWAAILIEFLLEF